MTARGVAGACFAAAALAAVAWNGVYLVAEGRQAVLTRFGAPVAVVSPTDAPSPGLHTKWPVVEQAVRLDGRLQSFTTTALATPDADGRRLEIRALVAYRVADPFAVVRAGGAEAVRARLDGAASQAVAAAFQGAAPAELLSGHADPGRLEAARAALAALVAADRLGVQVSDLSLQGASLPETDRAAAEAEEQAALTHAAMQVRADGDAERKAALASADREAADIRGEGEAAALRARGQGDAARADILGAAGARDPAFATYLARLDSYDGALNPATTTLVLSPESNAYLSTFSHGPPQRR